MNTQTVAVKTESQVNNCRDKMQYHNEICSRKIWPVNYESMTQYLGRKKIGEKGSFSLLGED